DAFVVAGLGRLVPVKGFDVLVKALGPLAEAVPSARLVLIGDGPQRPELESAARASGVGGRVRITGITPDIVGWLAAADVLAAPSRNEGMGRAIVEAMAPGLPVVGAQGGGIPAVVAAGEPGWLVPAGASLALRAVRARGEALRMKLGTGAVARAEAFSTDVAHAAMRAIYAELAREKRLAR